MLDQARHLYAWQRGFAEQLVADIPAANFTKQATGGVGNSPAWILGHLCVSGDFALQLLNVHSLHSHEWHQAFGAGKAAGSLPDPCPTKSDLIEAFGQTHEAFDKAAADADGERLAMPHGVGFLEGSSVKTIGEMVAMLMTTHESMHLGQLSLWRRMHGLPALF